VCWGQEVSGGGESCARSRGKKTVTSRSLVEELRSINSTMHTQARVYHHLLVIVSDGLTVIEPRKPAGRLRAAVKHQSSCRTPWQVDERP
jgi:hypothetical protein